MFRIATALKAKHPCLYRSYLLVVAAKGYSRKLIELLYQTVKLLKREEE